MDETHFTPPDISSGYAEFTSDRGVNYEVTILDDKDCTPDYVAKDEDELIKDAQEEICPKCGNEKYSWKKYCNRCTDELENTCSQCGGFEYRVNGGICDDCKDKAENTCSKCGAFEYYVYGGLCDDCKEKAEEE